jgi:outer membrane protein OmpA-like peptidoglycan-associated protein
MTCLLPWFVNNLKYKNNKMKNSILVVEAFLMLTGCATMNKQQKGSSIGTAGGAAIGALVSKGSVWGILAGAAIGGVAGNLIGKKMDQQAKELQQSVPTATVERLGEGISMTFESGLMFKVNSSEISETYKEDLNSVTEVFVKYPETNIVIEGHTDDSGSDQINMTLSEKRAKAVGAYLVSKGVAASRITEKWYGESQPKYPNDTEANRQKNRRVELAITSNTKMQQEAKEGKLK